MSKCGVFSEVLNVIGRIMLLSLFVWAGYGKIGGYEGTAQYMSSMGVPTFFLPLVILLELGGGIAIMFGFLTRPLSIFMAIFSVIAAILFHQDWTNDMQTLMFVKDVSIAGGLLILASLGGGKFSIDHLIKEKFLKK
jgi:putative oxidoreductase